MVMSLHNSCHSQGVVKSRLVVELVSSSEANGSPPQPGHCTRFISSHFVQMYNICTCRMTLDCLTYHNVIILLLSFKVHLEF